MKSEETRGLFPPPAWFGFVIDNRQLLDALQDGWLRPMAPRTGMTIGVGTYVRGNAGSVRKPHSGPGSSRYHQVAGSRCQRLARQPVVFAPRFPGHGVRPTRALAWRSAYLCNT